MSNIGKDKDLRKVVLYWQDCTFPTALENTAALSYKVYPIILFTHMTLDTVWNTCTRRHLPKIFSTSVHNSAIQEATDRVNNREWMKHGLFTKSMVTKK